MLYQTDDELTHYGVVGMKWGVHKAHSLIRSNKRLTKKAAKYDKIAVINGKKSEKAHQDIDLKTANESAIKAKKYARSAANASYKAARTNNEYKRDKYERQAAKYTYKSEKANMTADRISKIQGYGIKALKYSIKSNDAKAKAARVRYELAKNTQYINSLNRKIADISKTDIELGQKYLNTLYK